jgi:hypothetical protein
VTLRASFTDRTLAWVSSWGRKKLISAPFLFHPQRFFEVGLSQEVTALLEPISLMIWENYGLDSGKSEQANTLGPGSQSQLCRKNVQSFSPYANAREPVPRNTGIMSSGEALSLNAPLSFQRPRVIYTTPMYTYNLALGK